MEGLSKLVLLLVSVVLLTGCTTQQGVKGTIQGVKVFSKKDEVVVIIREGNRVADVYVAPHFYRPRGTENYQKLKLGNLKNPFNENAKYGRALLFSNLATAGIFLMEHGMEWNLDPQSKDYWMRIMPKTSKIILEHFENQLQKRKEELQLDCPDGTCPDVSEGEDNGNERTVPEIR